MTRRVDAKLNVQLPCRRENRYTVIIFVLVAVIKSGSLPKSFPFFTHHENGHVRSPGAH